MWYRRKVLLIWNMKKPSFFHCVLEEKKPLFYLITLLDASPRVLDLASVLSNKRLWEARRFITSFTHENLRSKNSKFCLWRNITCTDIAKFYLGSWYLCKSRYWDKGGQKIEKLITGRRSKFCPRGNKVRSR